MPCARAASVRDAPSKIIATARARPRSRVRVPAVPRLIEGFVRRVFRPCYPRRRAHQPPPARRVSMATALWRLHRSTHSTLIH